MLSLETCLSFIFRSHPKHVNDTFPGSRTQEEFTRSKVELKVVKSVLVTTVKSAKDFCITLPKWLNTTRKASNSSSLKNLQEKNFTLNWSLYVDLLNSSFWIHCEGVIIEIYMANMPTLNYVLGCKCMNIHKNNPTKKISYQIIRLF